MGCIVRKLQLIRHRFGASVCSVCPRAITGCDRRIEARAQLCGWLYWWKSRRYRHELLVPEQKHCSSELKRLLYRIYELETPQSVTQMLWMPTRSKLRSWCTQALLPIVCFWLWNTKKMWKNFKLFEHIDELPVVTLGTKSGHSTKLVCKVILWTRILFMQKMFSEI